jgi:hypothetical protein
MGTSKGILGEEIILSSISSFSINLLVLTYNYNCVNTVIALAALSSFEIILINAPACISKQKDIHDNFKAERSCTSIFIK